MDALTNVLPALRTLAPVVAVVAFTAAGLWLADWLLLRRGLGPGAEKRFARQIVMMVLTAVAVVLIVLTLPISETTRGQLLSLLGLALTAVIALSSTTFVANVMAGFMLRSVGNFRPGDFVKVGEQFGRVTVRGLFHTEIQTEDRDLTTLPNLYLIQQPVTVIHASGTIVSTTLSLGYDLSHARIEPLLVEAADKAELQEPFVQVIELGNYAVTYRIAGFLPDVKHLLTARSNLRQAVLDTLHADGVEIVSPTFMNQRPLPEGMQVIPSDAARTEAAAVAEGGPAAATETAAPAQAAPEEMIFDKAEEAGKIEELRAAHAALREEIEELHKRRAAASKDEKATLDREIETRKSRLDALAAAIERAEEVVAKES